MTNQYPGANTRYYSTEKSGIYKLLGLNSAGCGTFSDEMYVEYSSVDDNFSNPFTISPNPSKGEFNLELSCVPNDLIEYTVTNALGEKLNSISTRSNSEHFQTIINLNGQS